MISSRKVEQFCREYWPLLLIISVIFAIICFRLSRVDAYCEREVVLLDQASRIEVLFSPADPVTKRLLELIRAESKSIDCAVYMITDSEIAKELLAAHERGVCVSVIVDASMLGSDRKTALKILRKTNRLRAYSCEGDGIMHNKFALFHSQKILWTGSFNWTIRAQQENQENVMIIKDEQVWQIYAKKFTQLYEQALHLSSSSRLQPILKQKMQWA